MLKFRLRSLWIFSRETLAKTCQFTNFYWSFFEASDWFYCVSLVGSSVPSSSATQASFCFFACQCYLSFKAAGPTEFGNIVYGSKPFLWYFRSSRKASAITFFQCLLKKTFILLAFFARISMYFDSYGYPYLKFIERFRVLFRLSNDLGVSVYSKFCVTHRSLSLVFLKTIDSTSATSSMSGSKAIESSNFFT